MLIIKPRFLGFPGLLLPLSYKDPYPLFLEPNIILCLRIDPEAPKLPYNPAWLAKDTEGIENDSRRTVRLVQTKTLETRPIPPLHDLAIGHTVRRASSIHLSPVQLRKEIVVAVDIQYSVSS